MLLTDGDVLLHVVGGAQSHGHPLMDVLRLDVQDLLVAGGGHAARLLDDVSHGVALVEQPQLQGNEKERLVLLKRVSVRTALSKRNFSEHSTQFICGGTALKGTEQSKQQ